MTDNFDPTMRFRESPGTDEGTDGGEQAGMDPEGLMPADSTLHQQGDVANELTSPDSLTTPHDQPAEGGREQAEDDPLQRR
jgi:hypothetical protein